MENIKFSGKTFSKAKLWENNSRETILGNVSLISSEEDVPTRDYVLVGCKVKSNKPKKREMSTQTECPWPPPAEETEESEGDAELLGVEDEMEEQESGGGVEEKEGNLEPEQPAEENVAGKEVQDDCQIE